MGNSDRAARWVARRPNELLGAAVFGFALPPTDDMQRGWPGLLDRFPCTLVRPLLAANRLSAGYYQLGMSIERIRVRRQLGAPSNRLQRERITEPFLCRKCAGIS
jgi:hypothetical protein